MLFGRKKDSPQDAIEDAVEAGGGVAVAEPPPTQDEPAPVEAKPAKKNKKQDDDELEYEWELDTPFGKIEFELEPAERKERKDQLKREKAEREAAKKAAKLAKRAEKAARKRNAEDEIVVVKRNMLVPALVIFAIVVVAIGVAVWLFARPGDEDEDVVPEEFRADGVPAAGAQQGIGARLKKAIRAGRQASREAQREQQQKFEEAKRPQ
jgi:hypothetical protein